MSTKRRDIGMYAHCQISAQSQQINMYRSDCADHQGVAKVGWSLTEACLDQDSFLFHSLGILFPTTSGKMSLQKALHGRRFFLWKQKAIQSMMAKAIAQAVCVFPRVLTRGGYQQVDRPINCSQADMTPSCAAGDNTMPYIKNTKILNAQYRIARYKIPILLDVILLNVYVRMSSGSTYSLKASK